MLEEITTFSKREYMLTLAVCLLSGLVIGMLVSPNKRVMIGSHNGNGYDEDDKKAKDKKSKKKSGVVDWEEVEQKEL